MGQNLVFVSGVHGVGKSTICKAICNELNLYYLSASELIKWSEFNRDPANKLVEDISKTQERLVSALNFSRQQGGNCLLDGHVCLFNSKSEVTRISLQTFELINPSIMCVITGTPHEIEESQKQRGGQVYSRRLIEEMQNSEVAHARQISTDLNVPLIQVHRSLLTYLILEIKTILKL